MLHNVRVEHHPLLLTGMEPSLTTPWPLQERQAVRQAERMEEHDG